MPKKDDFVEKIENDNAESVAESARTAINLDKENKKLDGIAQDLADIKAHLDEFTISEDEMDEIVRPSKKDDEPESDNKHKFVIIAVLAILAGFAFKDVILAKSKNISGKTA